MGKRAVLGLDIGGSKTLCALIDENFRLVEEIKFRTDPTRGERRYTKALFHAVHSLQNIAKKNRLTVVGAGAAIAGLADRKTGTVREAPNILFLKDYPLRKKFARRAELPLVVDNDVQLGLYGEQQLGAAKGYDHVLGAFLGTGVGGAAILNGKLYDGVGGVGGQVGSILLQPFAPPELTQNYGTLDSIASKASLFGAALTLGLKQWAPHLYRQVGTDLSKISWGVLADAIHNGDTHIEDLLKSRLRLVGVGLSNVVNFANPEMLVLGGGLTEAMPRLVLSQVEKGLRRFLVGHVGRDLKVVTAKLKNRAGVFGAAKWAFETFGNQPKIYP